MSTYSYSVETLEVVLASCSADQFNKLSTLVSEEIDFYKNDEQQRVYEIFWNRLQQLSNTSKIN